MPTATATTPPEAEQVQIPAAIWQTYRFRRSCGDKPATARSEALEGSGLTSGRAREAMAAALTAREAERGLAQTAEEREAELLAEGIEDVPLEPEPGSTQAIRRDAARTVDELEVTRARLAPEALTDPKVRAELATIESDIAEARSLLDLVDTAQGEIDRRTREAIEATRRAAIEHAEATAQGLQPQIRKAAARLDTAAATFAESVAAYKELKELQAAAIAGTDRGQEAVRARSYRPAEVSSALFVALREHGVEVKGVDGRNHAQPLAALEPEAL
jgi:hypothetical protein